MSILWPLFPLLALSSYFFTGLFIYLARYRRDASLEDAEVRERPASRVLGRTLRHYLMWMIRPWERGLVRLGVSPTTLTLVSLVFAAAAAVSLGAGAFALGGWLYLLAGILDILDGRVARATSRVTRSGAYVDSVIDRYAELLVFAGLAVYYRGGWELGVVLGAAIGSVMVSYARARGEALGVDVRVGTMQRPERLAWIGIIVAHAPLWELAIGSTAAHPRYWPAVIAIGVLAISSNITAARRILHTVRALDGAAPAESPRPTRRTLRLLDRLTTG